MARKFPIKPEKLETLDQFRARWGHGVPAPTVDLPSPLAEYLRELDPTKAPWQLKSLPQRGRKALHKYATRLYEKQVGDLRMEGLSSAFVFEPMAKFGQVVSKPSRAEYLRYLLLAGERAPPKPMPNRDDFDVALEILRAQELPAEAQAGLDLVIAKLETLQGKRRT